MADGDFSNASRFQPSRAQVAQYRAKLTKHMKDCGFRSEDFVEPLKAFLGLTKDQDLFEELLILGAKEAKSRLEYAFSRLNNAAYLLEKDYEQRLKPRHLG